MLLVLQEVSIHVYEKRGGEKVGRGRRKEGIAELLSRGVARLQFHSCPFLLKVVHGVSKLLHYRFLLSSSAKPKPQLW